MRKRFNCTINVLYYCTQPQKKEENIPPENTAYTITN